MRGSTLQSFLVVTFVGGCAAEPADRESEAISQSAVAIVTVETVEPPTLIVYRTEASATWQAPLQTGPSRFELAVDGPYRVTVVCDELVNGAVWVRQFARTPDDDRALSLACDTVPSAHHVTGTMLQSGWVRLGTGAAVSRRAGWQFDVPADRGAHALVAYSDDRIAIRRNLAVPGDTALDQPIDLITDGVALEPVTLTPTNLDGTELVSTGIVWLDIAGTPALFANPLAETRVVPSSILSPYDVQQVTVTVHNATVGRTVTRAFRAGDSTIFPLPEALGPVAFDAESVTWSTLPDFDVFELSFDAFSFETFSLVFHYLEVSQSFIASTAASSVAIDIASIPAFSPTWQIDLSQEHHRFAGVTRELPNGDVVGSDVSEVINGLEGI
jgi:hypothetical protein